MKVNVELSADSIREILPMLESELAELKIKRGKINHEIETTESFIAALKAKLEAWDALIKIKASV